MGAYLRNRDPHDAIERRSTASAPTELGSCRRKSAPVQHATRVRNQRESGEAFCLVLRREGLECGRDGSDLRAESYAVIAREKNSILGQRMLLPLWLARLGFCLFFFFWIGAVGARTHACISLMDFIQALPCPRGGAIVPGTMRHARLPVLIPGTTGQSRAV